MKKITPLLLPLIFVPFSVVSCSHTEDFKKKSIDNMNPFLPAEDAKLAGVPIKYNDEIRVMMHADALPASFLSEKIMNKITDSLKTMDTSSSKKLRIIIEYINLTPALKNNDPTIANTKQEEIEPEKFYYWREYEVAIPTNFIFNYVNIKNLFYSPAFHAHEMQKSNDKRVNYERGLSGVGVYFNKNGEKFISSNSKGLIGNMSDDIVHMSSNTKDQVVIYFVDYDTVDLFDIKGTANRIYKSVKLPYKLPDYWWQTDAGISRYQPIHDATFSMQAFMKAYNTCSYVMNRWQKSTTMNKQDVISNLPANTEVDPALIGLNASLDSLISDYKVKLIKDLSVNKLLIRVIIHYKTGAETSFVNTLTTA